jgi:hypothetical protein
VEGAGAGEDCMMRSFINLLFTKYYQSDQVEEVEMRGACGTDGRDEKCIEYFGWQT